MSRIGKRPIVIPQGVNLSIEGRTVNVKGPRGELSSNIPLWDNVEVKLDGGAFVVKRSDNLRETSMGQGLIRALVANMIKGVTEGFTKELDIVGVGYKAEVKGNLLKLNLGFSHDVDFEIPKGIKITLDKQTHIVINGADKGLVGETAARIRRIRAPEPYKGKGVKYTAEVIKHKVGKAAVGSTVK